MRACLTSIFLFLFSSFTVVAQNEIEGTVKSYTDEPLTAVVLKVMNGNRIAGYGKTNSNGEFRIKLSVELPDTLVLFANCLGYEQLRQVITRTTPHVELKMRESAFALKEVTVQAPKVSQKDDTVRFRLNAFTGKSDRTLEDGLKRLPGVEVEETGKVSYQGKEISDFYVENRQLVGNNYGLVTKNMPAEYVTEVEFVENHQRAAMDKGKMSDEVALNVKLSNKAKFKPVGTAEAMAGVQHNRFLYRIGGTGMMFSTKFQTMMTLKAGNYDSGNIFSPSTLISDPGLQNYAASALGQLTGAVPPLSHDTYAFNNDIGTSINFLRTVSTAKTLRINLSYNYERSRHYYSQSNIYSVDGGEIVLSESGKPQTISHLPFLNVVYTDNDTNKYVINDFGSKFDITTNDFNLTSAGRNFYQTRNIRACSLSDNFSWRKRFGDRTYYFNTRLVYLVTPTAVIDVSSPDHIEARQSASGHTLKWNGSTALEWRRGASR